jgi:hypothetical protein
MGRAVKAACHMGGLLPMPMFMPGHLGVGKHMAWKAPRG